MAVSACVGVLSEKYTHKHLRVREHLMKILSFLIHPLIQVTLLFTEIQRFLVTFFLIP